MNRSKLNILSQPLISVIIPTKNRIQELIKSIQSALNQTHSNIEILVVDDKSEEDIQKAVNSFETEKVKYFLNESSISNANVCRNIGLNKSKGDFVAMLDSDDQWKEDHLASSLSYLVENNCDGVFGSIIIDDGEVQTIAYSPKLPEGQKMINYILEGGNVQTSSHLYKRETALKVGWDETLLRHQDFDFAVRFGKEFLFLAKMEPTTIVNWIKGEKRTEDFESIMRFIKYNKPDILIKNYINYHKNIFLRIKNRDDVDFRFKKHYKSEALSCINILPLNDYLLICDKKYGVVGRYYLRVKYVFTVLFKF